MAATRPSPLAAADRAETAAKAVSPASAIPAKLRRWCSSELFGPGQEVEIEHGPSVYRLRKTAMGKLILNK